MININVTHTVIVEGLLKSDGLTGNTSRGGGSGGCILIDTHTIEGKGTIQVRKICSFCVTLLSFYPMS